MVTSNRTPGTVKKFFWHFRVRAWNFLQIVCKILKYRLFHCVTSQVFNITKKKNDEKKTLNPLSARAFFWAFFLKISKIWLCNAISQEWINQNRKFCIPFCSKFYPLSKSSGTFFIIFIVSGVTAVQSDHGVMSYIPDIGT